jgi:hypothetical protein
VISTFWIFCAIDYEGLRADELGGCPEAVKGFLELVHSRQEQITFDVDINSLTQICAYLRINHGNVEFTGGDLSGIQGIYTARTAECIKLQQKNLLSNSNERPEMWKVQFSFETFMEKVGVRYEKESIFQMYLIDFKLSVPGNIFSIKN